MALGMAGAIICGAIAPQAAVAQEATTLKDATGALQVEAPGRWRPRDSSHSFEASGFLGGVKSARMFGDIYRAIPTAAGAMKRWKEARKGLGDSPTFTDHDGDANRVISYSAEKKVLDFVRVVEGQGMSAAVWVRLKGAPGELTTEGFAVLESARIAAPATEKPAGGSAGEKPEPEPEELTKYQDKELRIELSLPAAFKKRKEVELGHRRLLSLRGPVGKDDDAYIDVYAFDAFDRVDAVGFSWIAEERRGWEKPVQIDGSPPDFKILVEDELWTRHIRLLDTVGGIFAIKVDVESECDPAAARFLDHTIASGFKVLKERSEEIATPSGFKPLEGKTHMIFAEGGGSFGEDFAKEAATVEGHVKDLLGLAPQGGRQGYVRVFKNQDSLDTAVRGLGYDPGDSAYWVQARRMVYTHANAMGGAQSHATLLFELTREAVQRRFGFPAPFWVEYGAAFVVAASAHNKGRMDQAHPGLIVAARGAAAGTVDYEQLRFWTHEDSVENGERRAIAYTSVAFLGTKSGPSKSFTPSFKKYLKKLATTGDPAAANKVFDLAKGPEFVDEWKRFVRQKL